MKDTTFQSITEAAMTHKAALIAKDAMNANLTTIMRKLITPGQIIEIGYDQFRELNIWLLDVKTIRGNDRGAKKFRIESEVTVEAQPDSFELARWSCEATPINKLGKAMSGRSHGADGNRDTVKLVGGIMPMAPIHLTGELYRKWCIGMLCEIIEEASKVRNCGTHEFK